MEAAIERLVHKLRIDISTGNDSLYADGPLSDLYDALKSDMVREGKSTLGDGDKESITAQSSGYYALSALSQLTNSSFSSRYEELEEISLYPSSPSPPITTSQQKTSSQSPDNSSSPRSDSSPPPLPWATTATTTDDNTSGYDTLSSLVPAESRSYHSLATDGLPLSSSLSSMDPDGVVSFGLAGETGNDEIRNSLPRSRSTTREDVEADEGGEYDLSVSALMQPSLDRKTTTGTNFSVDVVNEWNDRFKLCRSLPSSNEAEILQKASSMTKLLLDFNHISLSIGQLIISEYFLPDEKKTIKRINRGGSAGGDKYEVAGIFFKLAVSKTGNGIYRTDELAAKAASHDMKGLLNIYECIVDNFDCGVPLQSIIDYRGFRLTAMSILPLNLRQQPVMGTADGGLTVHGGDKPLMDIVKGCADRLNLKEHEVGKATLYFGCDVEGHKGIDGKYYFLDFARVFPPEHPGCTSHLVRDTKSIFYRLLRPEFVRSYPNKLSPDACSAFSAEDPLAMEQMRDIQLATQDLIGNRIVGYVEELHHRGSMMNYSFSKHMHRWGINMRHLGLVRNHLLKRSTKDINDACLVEIISRVLKNLLRSDYRMLLHGDGISAENAFIEVTVEFLNLVSCASPKVLSKVFWDSRLPSEIKKRYGSVSITDNESKDLFNRMKHVLYDIFIRLFDQMKLTLTQISLKQLKINAEGFRFLPSDIKSISPRLKSMHIFGESTSLFLSKEANKIMGRWRSYTPVNSLSLKRRTHYNSLSAGDGDMKRVNDRSSERDISEEAIVQGSREVERLLSLSDEYLSSAYDAFPAHLHLLHVRAFQLIRQALLPHMNPFTRLQMLEKVVSLLKSNVNEPSDVAVSKALGRFHHRLGYRRLTFSSSVKAATQLMDLDEKRLSHETEEIVNILDHVLMPDKEADLKVDIGAMQVLINGLTFNGSLDNLDVSKNVLANRDGSLYDEFNQLCDVLQHNNVLTSLNLSECSLGDRGAEALAKSLQLNNAVVYLNVSKNDITVLGGVAIGHLIQYNKTLKALDLSRNHIGHLGSKTLAGSLKGNNSLIVLNVADNYLEDKQIEHLCKALSSNSALTVLNVQGNDITEQGLAALTALSSANVWLRTLTTTKLKSGEEYLGGYIDGKRHGMAVVKFASGDEVEGEYVEGVLAGKCRYTYEDGTIYHGIIANGLPNTSTNYASEFAEGLITFKNGDVYKGQVVDGMMHGRGCLMYKNKDIYTGYLKQNKKYGTGTLAIYEDKSFYEGEFRDDVFHGTGRWNRSDGSVFNGALEFGHPNGVGFMEYSNRDVYDGNFLDGLRDGHGTCQFSNGDIYTGEWSQDLMHGLGEFICKADRTTFLGEFHANRKHGRGKMIYDVGGGSDGQHFFDSFWDENVRRHSGKAIFSIHTSLYEGEFIEHNIPEKDYSEAEYPPNLVVGVVEGGVRVVQMHGKGVLKVKSTGLTYEGKFKNNRKSGKGILRQCAIGSDDLFGKIIFDGIFDNDQPKEQPFSLLKSFFRPTEKR